jgi:hypothetical protein
MLGWMCEFRSSRNSNIEIPRVDNDVLNRPLFAVYIAANDPDFCAVTQRYFRNLPGFQSNTTCDPII